MAFYLSERQKAPVMSDYADIKTMQVAICYRAGDWSHSVLPPVHSTWAVMLSSDEAADLISQCVLHARKHKLILPFLKCVKKVAGGWKLSQQPLG